ncbi:MAG: ParB/RepB/Spo0J family partition protein [Bacteroidales bacterium]|nr:ParB/RepB/Spo0J family partition protein [Bacteroidales bacterium]
MKPIKTGLGRGLGALIPMDDTSSSMAPQNAPSSINEIDLELIHANPSQPRREFDEQALEELANSIRSVGIIQPITLRQEEDGTYLIIAGERRYRAAQRAGLLSIPAYIRKVSDDAVMEMTLIENIQREDLNAIEVALAYQQLLTRNQLTQEELSQHVGKSRATVANFMRLLRLPAEIQLALKDRRISMGHARALLSIEDAEQQVALYHQIVSQDLSVRRVENLVREFVEGRILDFRTEGLTSKKVVYGKQGSDELFSQMTQHLSEMFSTKVRMSCNEKGQGKITIPFRNDEELRNIIALLDKIN